MEAVIAIRHSILEGAYTKKSRKTIDSDMEKCCAKQKKLERKINLASQHYISSSSIVSDCTCNSKCDECKYFSKEKKKWAEFLSHNRNKLKVVKNTRKSLQKVFFEGKDDKMKGKAVHALNDAQSGFTKSTIKTSNGSSPKMNHFKS